MPNQRKFSLDENLRWFYIFQTILILKIVKIKKTFD